VNAEYRRGLDNPLVDLRAPHEGDLGAVARLLDARADILRSDWDLPSFDLARDAWLAEQDGALVGYAAVMPAERLVVAGSGGVADALIGAAIARARELGFHTLRFSTSGDPAAVRRHGFELVQETLAMRRPLRHPEAEPTWPAGIAVRTFEPGDAAAVHTLLDEAYRAWDSRYVPLAHDDWLRWMTGDPDFDATVWWLAERDGELAGCALHWSTGWLKDVAVRAAERGRGLGGALVQHGIVELARRGIDSVGLKVDAANPTGAPRLYERLGFVVERREGTWASTL
jgi:ribosomal protein S18 acetylase RimI-like enzyme